MEVEIFQVRGKTDAAIHDVRLHKPSCREVLESDQRLSTLCSWSSRVAASLERVDYGAGVSREALASENCTAPGKC